MNMKLALLTLIPALLVGCVTSKDVSKKKELKMDVWVWTDLSSYEGTLVDVNIVGPRVEIETYSMSEGRRERIENDTVYPKPEKFAAFEKTLSRLNVKTWEEDYKGQSSEFNQTWHVHLRGVRKASEGVNLYPQRKDPKKTTTKLADSELKDLMIALQKLVGQNVFGL